jgi:hypothetical protein
MMRISEQDRYLLLSQTRAFYAGMRVCILEYIKDEQSQKDALAKVRTDEHALLEKYERLT